MSDDDEAAQAYNMLNEDDEADEWNQEFREVEKAAGNPGREERGRRARRSRRRNCRGGGCGGTHYRRDDERPRRPRHQVDGRPSFARILLLSSPLQSVCSIFLEERFLRR